MEQLAIFTSKDLRLAGTLRVPDSTFTSAAVLLIPGSGQVDRNENHKKLHINALKEIADYLTDRRMVTFRYDKRGVGLSEGNYWQTGFYDNVADASAALDYLRVQPECLNKPLFVLGHSEGALIATRLAAERVEITGAILLAGSAQTGEAVLQWQAAKVAKSLSGFNKLLIKLLRVNVLKTQQKYLHKIKTTSKDWIRQGLTRKINAKWLREFMVYNPADDLPKIRVPLLAATGAKDIQVNPLDLELMAKLVKTDFESHQIPNMTHLLRTETGEPTISTYTKQIKQPLDSQLLELIGDWLSRKTGIPAG